MRQRNLFVEYPINETDLYNRSVKNICLTDGELDIVLRILRFSKWCRPWDRKREKIEWMEKELMNGYNHKELIVEPKYEETKGKKYESS